jgi:hypothetical protein
VAEDSNAAGGWCDGPCDAAEDRRLPGTVRPAKGESLALLEPQVEVAYDVASAEAPSEAFDQERFSWKGGRRQGSLTRVARHAALCRREIKRRPLRAAKPAMPGLG